MSPKELKGVLSCDLSVGAFTVPTALRLGIPGHIYPCVPAGVENVEWRVPALTHGNI